MIAGVCTGVAAYTGIDVVAIRIATVVLALFTGVGLVGYIVAWLVMPMAVEGDPLPPPPSDPTRVRRWVGIGAVVLGATVLFRNTFELRGSIFWGLLLIGVGIAFFGWELTGRNGDGRPVSLPRPTPPPVASPPASIGGGAPPIPPTVTAPAAPVAPAPSPARREPSMLGRLVVGAAALAVGVGLLLDNLAVFELKPQMMLIILVAIVGIGLVVGAWWGRARWLIFPGVALLFALGAATVIPDGFKGGTGEKLWQPTSLSELRRNYRHGAGEGVLDLSRVEFDRRDRTINVRQSFGELLVIVPDDVPVHATGQVTGGEIRLFGRTNSGWEAEGNVREPGDPDLGTLTINARVAFGEITVRRDEPGDAGRFFDDNRGLSVDVGPGFVRVDRGNDR
jgi:phage shock protein PspC (stress-responsive transcriptional regulator)